MNKVRITIEIDACKLIPANEGVVRKNITQLFKTLENKYIEQKSLIESNPQESDIVVQGTVIDMIDEEIKTVKAMSENFKIEIVK